MIKIPEDFKIGLSLSGGAAYGIAHIGVLKALREFGIEPDYLYGTSAGAVAAVLYASGASIRDMKKFVEGIDFLSVRKFRFSPVGLLPLTYLQKRVAEFVPYENLEDLPRKTMIGVTNLETGFHESLETGPISSAVSASCGVPVVFSPTEHNGNIYVDGGVSNNMPALPLHKYCDFIMGCDVVEAAPLDRKYFKDFRKIFERTLTISLTNRTTFNYMDCDFVIRPQGLSRFGKFDISQLPQMFPIGYNQTLIDLPDILDGIQQKIKEKMELNKMAKLRDGSIEQN